MVWDSFFLCLLKNHANSIFTSKNMIGKIMIIEIFHIFKKNGEKNFNFFSETTIFLFLVKIDLRLLKHKLEKIIFRRVINV